ncbi:class I SAM-dependent methyltransferase [Nonomuraea sp. NPDC059194]|uniref:class I SAM-dependent methyltransferase n=1 Tax=Nonomuraea sp. NPDC059194 TaxID=3346764 RepID=UPI003696C819
MELRRIFDEDALLYDRARPGYPAELFTRIPVGSRVLEIGCGTGQATRGLLARGCRVTAVELGPSLAALARERMPSVEVVNADFETWLPAEPYDVVFAATAFHWLDPATRVAKARAALRPGGMLATVATHHVAGGTEAFFAEVQECYERFDPATPPDLRLSPASAIPHDGEPMPGFAAPAFERWEWELTYTTETYLDLLSTYSNHRALPARADLLACIGSLITTRYGGQVVKRYLTELRTATAKDG